MHDWRRDLGEAVTGGAAELRFAEPMAGHTTFRIGGLADAWVRCDDRQTLARVLDVCRAAGLRTWVLGNGSNVLISDQGLRGVVISLGGELAAIREQRSEGLGDSTGDVPDTGIIESPTPRILSVGAGAALDAVAVFAEVRSLVGAEFLAGIPGTVGGGLHSNAGALGRSLGDIVTAVTVLGPDGRERAVEGTHLCREYRRPMIDEGLVAVEVRMELADRIQGSEDSRGQGADAGILSAVATRKQRWAKHPKEASAGSFFKNPVNGNGGRVPAGRLIEQCGLKGKAVGRARVSDAHANFIVNTGGARFADVYQLAQVVKATVEEQTGIELEEEVQYLPGPAAGQGRGPGRQGSSGSGCGPEHGRLGTIDRFLRRR